MNLRKTGRMAIAGLAVVAALGLTACGSDDKKDPPQPSRTTTSAAANANQPAPPTVAELNALLQKALDPAVPSAEKLDLVQGIEADPDLPNRLAKAYKDANAKSEITGVTAFGDSVSAQGKLTINGAENPIDVPFVLDNGKWKVQKGWACNALTALNLQSPACS
ncbi:hypothetical protein [Nocardia suismassiliense]|uniref:hypothetical protein n=1 Tax=Nocardia suismassiliense TaxID=2077092 RepID=UPI0018FED5AA|nr:hypothetical protein [Nocardia suismassiliense]